MVLAWAINKVKRVVNSTLESETLALLDGLNHSQMLRDELADLLYGANGQNIGLYFIDDFAVIQSAMTFWGLRLILIECMAEFLACALKSFSHM